MDNDEKRSSFTTNHRTEFNTGLNSYCFYEHGKHKWRCFVNQKVNLQYGKLAQRTGSRSKSLKKKTLKNQIILTRKHRQKSQRELMFPIVRYSNFKNILEGEQTSNTQNNLRRKSQSVGVQTKDMVVLESCTYDMQEEERKYLRDSFMDHYGLLKGRKL